MKKSAKNYLTLAGGFLFLYFLFAQILSAHDALMAKRAMSQSASVQIGAGYFAAIVLLGAASAACFAWAWVSKGNRKSFKEVKSSRKSLISAAGITILGGVGAFALGTALVGTMPELRFDKPSVAVNEKPQESEVSSSQSASREQTTTETPVDEPKAEGISGAQAVMNITDAQTITARLAADQPDQSIVLAQNLSSVTLSQSILDKTGDSTDFEQTSKEGINAAVLGAPGSTLNLLGSIINTNAVGAPAIAVNGENATASVTDCDVTASSGSSPLFMTLNKGQMHMAGGLQRSYLDSSPIYFTGADSSLSADSQVVQTSADGSPIVYGAGTFAGNLISATSTAAPIAQMLPGSSTSFSSSTLNTGGFDSTSGMEGAFLFQNPDGATERKSASLSLDGCSILFTGAAAHPGAAAFYASGTDAEITLSGNMEVRGFGTLLSAADAKISLNASAQTMYGNAAGDDKSEISITLTNGSGLGGSINADQTLKKASLHIDASSMFALSQDTYLTEFENADASNSNIQTNGFHIYVNGKQVV